MILIIGRTCSGKDTFAKYLENLGLKGVFSSTTREKRPNEGSTHRFVSFEVAKKEMASAVAKTEINGNIYYTRRQDILDKDFYIIDFLGAKELVYSMPEVDFEIINIQCSEKDRSKRYIKRSNCTKDEFEKRNASESSQFDTFENGEPYQWPENVKKITVIQNDSVNKLELEAYKLLSIPYRVYISGAISNVANYKKIFNEAEKKLKKVGYVPVNPAKNITIVSEATYDEYMHLCYAEMEICQGIFFLNNWKKSRGARIEKKYAEKIGLKEIKHSQ